MLKQQEQSEAHLPVLCSEGCLIFAAFKPTALPGTVGGTGYSRKSDSKVAASMPVCTAPGRICDYTPYEEASFPVRRGRIDEPLL